MIAVGSTCVFYFLKHCIGMMIMNKVTVYDLNRYFNLCGSLFLLQYRDLQNAAKAESCHIYVGCKGPAVFDLPAGQMAFCYIGDFCSDRPLVQPVEWSSGPDDVKECDAVSFLRAHHIPYNINCLNAMTRKAEKYIYIRENGYLGDKGLAIISKWRDSISAYYYFSPGCVLDSSDPSVSIRYVNTYGFYYKSSVIDLLLSAFDRINQGGLVTIETFMQWIHVDRFFEKKVYQGLSGDRHDAYVWVKDSASWENALVLHDFFYDPNQKSSVQVFLAFSRTGALEIPCRVLIRGTRHTVEVPWQADINNVFLVYFDRDGERYLFVPAGFERREDGNYYCDLQDVLAKYGISLKVSKKGECRKLLNQVWKLYQNISAGSNGYCSGSSYRIDKYSPTIYYTDQYLKDCEIFGRKILDISVIAEKPHKDNITYWLPAHIRDLFRWGGKITEEKLLEDGEILLGNKLMFTTEDGILYIDCHYSDIRNNAPESIELRRDHKLVKKTDVTGFTWQEKAKALSEMMA